MAKKPETPNKPPKSVKTPAAKPGAGRPDVRPIGPALAELLNPAINRGDAGMGSSTGLQPPPSNSFERRSGGEAAVHRARKSTPKKFEGDQGPRPSPLQPFPQPVVAPYAPRLSEQKGLEETPQATYGTSA
ncbi:MAG: excinuclease ABC subunit UvrB, partial [Tardiphaga sp.]